MYLSELTTVLSILLENSGDQEIFEAAHEYGYKPITPESLGSFLRYETIKERNKEDKIILVIGRH